MIAEKICWFVYPLLLLRGILVVTHNHQAGHREDALMLINNGQQMVFIVIIVTGKFVIIKR